MEMARFSPCERVQQLTVEQIGDVPQLREEIVDEEAPETASQDRRLQRTGKRDRPSWTMSRLPKLRFRSEFLKGCVNSQALSGCPRILSHESVQKVKITPQEQLSGRTGEQIWVIEMPKIVGQESVVVTSVPQERSSERKGEQIRVIELPKISHQEGVELVKSVPQERISERIYERSEVIDVSKNSHQDNVEAVENIPQERISVRRCEQSEVIDVTKIPSQGPCLLRIVEQMIDVTEISDIGGEVWQRTVTLFLDD